MVTVFTPTYNRSKLLGRLYKSLQAQTCFDFEWLIVDDGSTDDTETQVTCWIEHERNFPINYHKVQNGGKMRAINYGLDLANGEFFCGIDSDDWFTEDAIETIKKAFKDISQENGFIGVCLIRGNSKGDALNCSPKFPEGKDFVDCTNLECRKYGLEGEMIKVFYTELQRKYKITVWEDEKFTPESVFLDAMALDGWKMRWLNSISALGEYENDGLTKASWRLLRDNPMGYAMMFNMQLRLPIDFKQRTNVILQFISCCCLKGEYSYMAKCNNRLGAFLLFVPGYLLGLRRKYQIERFCE